MKRSLTYMQRSIAGWLYAITVLLILSAGAAQAQPVTTTFTNNNGQALVTFNFQNTNAYDVIITDVSGITSLTGTNTAKLYYKTTAVAGLPGAISAANGWNLVATQSFAGVANTVTSTAQLMLTGLSLNIPAGTTYGLCVEVLNPATLAGTQRYSTLTAGTYTVTSGGCSIITGTNIGYGGAAAPASPTFTPRGFIGSINFTAATPCVGTPAPGNTLSTLNPVCPTASFTLSNQFPTPGTGVTYQWQSSPDGISYTNIAGATASTYTTTQTSATYYQCQVSCAGSPATSNPLYVTMNPFTSCYCASAATTAFDEEIYSVNVNGSVTPAAYSGVSGCSTPAPGAGSILGRYSNFTTLGSFATLGQGEVISFTIEENECDGATYYAFGTAIWIDFNQNGSYLDAGEKVFVENVTAVGPRNVVGTFTVPATATLGTTGMRIIVAEGYAGASLTPCLSYGYGETEDYVVTISTGTACAGTPTGGTVPASVTICSGTSTTLNVTGYTTGLGVSLQWQESPDGVAGWTNVTTGTGGTTPSYTTAALAADNYYRCLVTCTYSGESTPSTVCAVDVTTSPLGDTFANPIVIGSLPYSTTGNNQSINCWQNNFVGQTSPDVYYQITPECNGTMNINLCGGGTLTDTYLHLLNAAGTVLASNDDNGPSCAGLLSSINYTVSAGVTYYIVVEGYSAGQGTYSLSVSNAALLATWFADADGDSYGDPAVTTTTCDGIAPAGYVGNNLDCNDTDAAINPSAVEICNTLDDDCDALVDDADPDVTGLSAFFEDADGDGFGNGAVTVFACFIGPGYSVDPSDCDDTQSTVYPGATEICDGLDNDCNGEFDEGVVSATVTPGVGASTCKPDFFTFSANTGVGYTYQWFKNGTIITGATGATYATNKPAYYQVQVNVPGGCFALSTESFLTVYPAPNANIFTPNGTSLCTTVKLKASYDATYSWQWYKDDGAIPGATGYLYFPTTAGVYYCSITTADGCNRNTATVTVTACREDEPVVTTSALFEVYPNPSAGDFTINMELNTVETNAQVAVMNLLGDQIYSGNAQIANGTVNQIITLPEGTAAGMYIIRVAVADQEYTKQIVLQK